MTWGTGLPATSGVPAGWNAYTSTPMCEYSTFPSGRSSMQALYVGMLSLTPTGAFRPVNVLATGLNSRNVVGVGKWLPLVGTGLTAHRIRPVTIIAAGASGVPRAPGMSGPAAQAPGALVPVG